MKAISILSALVFAHAAFAQATDSTTAAAVSTTDSSAVDPATSTVLSSSTAVAATSTSNIADAASSSSASATSTGKKGGNKSSSSSAPSATSSGNNAAPTSGGSIWEDGTTTMTSSDGSPFILTGVSEACSTFLTQTNKDQKLSTCLTPMLNALSAFTTSGSGDASMVSKTMSNMCSTSDAGCSSTIKLLLTKFNDACSNDFESSKLLREQYDMMYNMPRFKEALCTKNTDSQNYCVADPGTASSKSKRSAIVHAREHLINPWVKRGSSQTYFTPNSDTYRNNNILFLFSSPEMSYDQLCTKCTQQVLTAYAKPSVPNALGQAQSPMSGGQIALFKAVNDKCGSSFVAPIVSAAGSPTADYSGASPMVNGGVVTAFAGALAALAALI